MFSKKIVLGVASVSAALAVGFAITHASSARAADTRMVVLNSTNHTLVNVYASSVNDGY